MKYIFSIMLSLLVIGCTSHKDIPLKTKAVYTVEHNGLPFFSFSVPEGHWIISPVTLNTMKRSWFDIEGVPPNSYVGYAIKFSIDSVDGFPKILKDVVPLLTTHDFNGYLSRGLARLTVAQQKEMNAKNYDGKVVYLQGYGCKNDWFEWMVAPQLNDGKGIAVFRSFVTCPLVIDGKIYRFNISIDSSVRPEYYTQKAEYDRTKQPEDPEISLDTDEILKTLGDKVIAMFSDIQFYGKVSQNYEDVIAKCDPNLGEECSAK